MRDDIAHAAAVVVNNPTVQKAVAASTVGTGVATGLEWVPTSLGVIASLVGLALSMVLIYTNLSQHRLKMQLLKRDLAGRRAREGRQDRRDD